MWSQKVLRQFATIPPNPSESDFHGPYNKLLNTLFPPDTDFVVVPQYMPDSRGASDFIFMFEVYLENRPVLIFELKPPSHLDFLSKREAADTLIRQRMDDLAPRCPLGTLHAVSALGTKMCFYTRATNTPNPEIHPIAIPRHPTRSNDVAPADRWNYDVLEPEGEQRLLTVVNEIKAGCAALDHAQDGSLCDT